MAIPSLIRAVLTDPKDILKVFNEHTTNVGKVLDYLTKRIQLDSQILSNISLKAGIVNRVPHQLNRAYQGRKIVGQNVKASFWDAPTNDNPSIYLNLMTDADCIVSIEVF